MAAFSVLPDFGFLTLGETERRRARRERKVGKEQESYPGDFLRLLRLSEADGSES